MRAHCINFHDENDRPVGDIWLSSPGEVKVLRLDVSGMSRHPVIELNAGQAVQLRNALTMFLALEANHA
jgi:hypothetical protein